jgi:hypothetical protein
MTTLNEPLLERQDTTAVEATNDDNQDAFFGKPPKKACYLKRIADYDKTFTINLGAIFFNNGVTQTFFSVVL